MDCPSNVKNCKGYGTPLIIITTKTDRGKSEIYNMQTVDSKKHVDSKPLVLNNVCQASCALMVYSGGLSWHF